MEITFDDGAMRRINFLPVLDTLVWPNGADFDPAMLHDWPEVEAEFVNMARSWARQRWANFSIRCNPHRRRTWSQNLPRETSGGAAGNETLERDDVRILR